MKRLVLLLLMWITSAGSTAQPSACPQHFANAEAPEIINQNLAQRTIALCYNGFALMHSGVARTALWSAQHMTAKKIKASKTIKRKNTFHAEERLPRADRAELRDYARSGFDRGHLTAAGDMPDHASQYESFSLANMVPQDPHHNQMLWSAIEEVTRKLASLRGELYVITGPIFEGSSLTRLNSRVLVPTHLYKAIYDPVSKTAAAYFAPNVRDAEYQTISIAELELRAGIRLFPAMPPHAKAIRMHLPQPKLRARKKHHAR